MDKYATIGELLYVISNYEKGRIRTSGMWSTQYTESLTHSFHIMSILLSLLETNRSISVQEMLPVFDYCKKNINICSSAKILNIDIFYENTSETIFTEDAYYNKSNKAILELMTNIADKCNLLIANKSKNYKVQLSWLLKAFHNLPKAFLDPSKQTLLNIGVHSISEEDALQYALFYLTKANIT